MTKRLVFVTGGTGYIGRSLIKGLIARGHQVRALARLGLGTAAEMSRQGLLESSIVMRHRRLHRRTRESHDLAENGH